MSSAVTVDIVHVVGGIAVGKSSLMERVERDPIAFVAALSSAPGFAWLADVDHASLDLVVVPEVPERWLDKDDGKPLLDRMYAEPAKYAARFQHAVLNERWSAMIIKICDTLREHDALPAAKHCPLTHLLLVTDGSIVTDHGVFARACADNGFMSADEWEAYDTRYSQLAACWPAKFEAMARELKLNIRVVLRGTLHLTTPLAETQTRIRQRGRDCEQTLPATYLDDILERHARLLAQPDYSAPPVVAIRDTLPSDPTPFAVQ